MKTKALPSSQSSFLAEAECQRCHDVVKVAGPGRAEATMLRLAKSPVGFCVNCATHDFLRHLYPVNMILHDKGPEILLHSESRQQFARVMEVAISDALPDEICWERVVQNWDLPFQDKPRQGPTNPYDPERDAWLIEERKAGRR